MSIETIRSLFRVLENTLHERLTVIEDVIGNQSRSSESNNGDVEQRVARLEDNNNKLELHQRVASLESIFGRIQDDVKSIRRDQIALTRCLDIIHANMQLESAGLRAVPASDERPVEAVEAEVELETAEAEALDADIDASEVERGATEALKDAVKALPAPVSVSAQEAEDEDAEDEAEEEGEEEGEEEVEEEVEAEEEEAEPEEEAGVSVEEFIYRNKTYYRDSDNKVYRADEEGDILDVVIGVWNPTTKKIQRTS